MGRNCEDGETIQKSKKIKLMSRKIIFTGPHQRLLLDLWECHRQFLGMAKPNIEREIDDIIPDGI